MVLCAVIVQLILFSQKNIFHGDEFFTFNMLSGHYSEYTRMSDTLWSREYILQMFNNTDATFPDMWRTLSLDVHLPFYFIMLWVIKLFVGTDVNFILYAQILNVLSLIGLLIGCYKLSCEIFKNKEVALASVFLFMFSAPVISLGILMRMYLLWIMLAVWQVYYTILFIKGYTDNRTLFFMGLFSFLQIFTHYYGFIFSFVLTGCTLFILLFNKNFARRKLVLFALTMLVSALMVFIFYPEMIDVVMHRHRGPEAMTSLQEWVRDPINTLMWRVRMLDEILPFPSKEVIIFMPLLIAAFAYVFKKNKVFLKDEIIFLILTFLFLLYSISIMVIMPNVSAWHDNAFRYFSLSYPIFFLLLTYFAIFCGHILRLKVSLVALILLVLAGINGIINANLNDRFLYFQLSGNREKAMKAIKDQEVWYNFSAGDIIHVLDGLFYSHDIFVLSDYESENFAKIAYQGKLQNKYAYLLMPKDFESSIPNIIDWIRKHLERNAYYLYTLENHPKMAVSLDMIVIMVAPY